jgi:hypothetical protein
MNRRVPAAVLAIALIGAAAPVHADRAQIAPIASRPRGSTRSWR